MIQNRLEVYEHNTKPVLEHYPKEKIVEVDATMSQIRVLHQIIDVLVPIKSAIDHARERQEQFHNTPPANRKAEPVGAKG